MTSPQSAAAKRAKLDGASDTEDAHNEEEEEEDEEDELDSAQHFIEEEFSKMSALLTTMSEEELSRFETARRCALKPKEVEKAMEMVLGGSKVEDKTVVVMAGLAKLYLIEVVELARVLASEEATQIRIQPRHLREAFRRLKRA